MSIPLPVWLMIAATLLPLASFVMLIFIGKRMGNPLAGIVATLAIGASFGCSVAALIFWLQGGVLAGGVPWGFGKQAVNLPIPWIPVGGGIAQDHPGFVDIGIYVDSLTVVMFIMVTLVSTVVHIFSIGYMADDKRFARFFTYLGLFGFSMLGLVLGGTILQLFIFWELVGLCSYLLIGFWYEKKSASNAAIKAFVTNRVGDMGFLVGLGILFYHLGNVTLPSLWITLGQAGAGHAVTLPGGGVFSAGLLTIMGIGLFFGAVGKSAQFPLHVWLPDAMEGPTPVSALIHAATMVAAGVYLVGRIFPILTPDAKLFIAIIGCTTLTMAALIAITQSDIKKVLAFSTLSQLGYMILAMGIGSWVGGLFHLLTHAFFKALLFLGSGSVIHAAHHEQEMTQYGGLWRKIPWTAATFGVATLTISGTPFLSAYYSKDLILEHAGAFAAYATHFGAHGSGFYWAFFILPVITAYMTAFYMTRCWMLTFAGKPRNQHVYDHAHERPVMWLPLVILAILSIGAGWQYLGIKELLRNAIAESANYCQAAMTRSGPGAAPGAAESPRFVGFSTVWPTDEHQSDEANATTGEGAAAAETSTHAAALRSPATRALSAGQRLMSYVTWAFAVGIALGVLIYWKGYTIANALMKVTPLRWIHTWLYHRMYFDELYYALFVNLLVIGLSRVARALDRWVIDGLVNGAATTVRQLADLAGLSDRYIVDGAVNGAAQLAQDVGAAVRAPQTGRIRMYVTILMVTATLGIAVAITAVVLAW